MSRRPGAPRLASVTEIPSSQRRRGRPYKTLSSAASGLASEREMLVLLRRKLASRIDASVDAPLAPLAALVKQFRDVDTRIRAIDLAAAEAAAQAGDDDDDNGCDDTGWDPSKL
jgi:hypothetical protein